MAMQEAILVGWVCWAASPLEPQARHFAFFIVDYAFRGGFEPDSV
jgi:hypothetical protein